MSGWGRGGFHERFGWFGSLCGRVTRACVIWCGRTYVGHMEGIFQTNTVASPSVSSGALSRLSAWLRRVPGVQSMWDLQVSVARQGVGAHLHTHKAVANAEIFGQKRWFLCPPSSPMNVRACRRLTSFVSVGHSFEARVAHASKPTLSEHQPHHRLLFFVCFVFFVFFVIRVAPARCTLLRRGRIF